MIVRKTLAAEYTWLELHPSGRVSGQVFSELAALPVALEAAAVSL